MGLKLLVLLVLLAASALRGGSSETASTEPAPSGEVAICSKGKGVGDCTAPQGIAVDTDSGAVYVADSGNGRVDSFAADGDNPNTFGKAEVQTWLAVDNDPRSPSHHDLYVASLDYKVQKFAPDGTKLDSLGGKGRGRCQLMRTIDPVGVGPGGQVDVVDTDEVAPQVYVSRIEQWSPKGKCEGEIRLFKGDLIPRNFTVDAKGNFYMTVAGTGGKVQKYNPEGKLLFQVAPESTSEGLAIGPHGELFVKQSGTQLTKPQLTQFYAEYTPAGKLVRRFDYRATPLFLVQGLAANRTPHGLLYASEQFVGVRHMEIPQGPQIVREPCRPRLRTLSGKKATLLAEVNPEGEPTHFHFTYRDGSTSKSTPPVPLGGNADFELHEAAQTVSGLHPSTAYHCRVVAEYSGGKPKRGLEGEFETAKG
jgi:sugar lactone lactonase YvrE